MSPICFYFILFCLVSSTEALVFFKCMGFKDNKYDITVAHGTCHLLPFNWSPNARQFVDVSRSSERHFQDRLFMPRGGVDLQNLWETKY